MHHATSLFATDRPSSLEIRVKVSPSPRALILFAHGSSRATWRAPLETLCAQIQSQSPAHVRVVLAFLERCPPTLPEVVTACVDDGFTHIDVLPMFISAGGHVLRDVPPLLTEIRAAHPALQLHMHPAIGAHPVIATAIAGLVSAPEQDDL